MSDARHDRRHDDLEGLLHSSAPRAPRGFLDQLAARSGPARPGGRRRGARRLLVLAVATGALASLGGLGWAGALGTQSAAKVSVRVVGQGARQVAVRNAASDVYQTTRSAGTGAISSPVISVLKLSSQTVPSTASATLAPARLGTAAGATANLTMTVEALGTPSAGFSGGTGSGIFLKVEVRNTATSAQVRQLPAPLELVINNPPTGFVPSYSSDGIVFRAIPSIAPRTALDAGEQDGWFTRGGSVVILTRHLTIFALLKPELVAVSATGVKRPAAGSGAFGDINRSKAGAPALSVDPLYLGKLAPKSTTRVIAIPFSVNEQAALTFSVADAAGKAVQILGRSSGIRGRQLTGGFAATLKATVLNPGSMTAGLAVPKTALGKGAKLTVTIVAVDFDGNRTTKTARLTVR